MKDNSFAKRVKRDFGDAILSELKKKSLEDITLASLCEITSYPRSTFYNHFSDIYGLLESQYELIYVDMKMPSFTSIPEEERTLALFDYLYGYMESKKEEIKKILIHNGEDGALLNSINSYMRKKIKFMIESCSHSKDYPIPTSIVIEHYADTVWMVSYRCFFLGKSKEEAASCIEYLLGGVGK